MARALYRFDVAPAIGAGHMARCLALAAALERRGFAPTLAVNEDGLGFLPEALRAEALPVAAGTALDGANLSERFDLAVVDHYRLGRDAETALRAHAARVVVIDDLADRDHDADVLVDTAPGQPAGRYDGRVGDETLRLLGSDYALLRDEFATARDAAAAGRKTAGRPRVLVSLGATDPDNVTALVLTALEASSDLGAVTVVLGAGAPHIAEVEARAAASSLDVTVLTGVSNMAELLLETGIAVGAPGTSALERACLGLPQILVETADNQRLVAAGFAALGAGEALGPAEGLTAERIAAAVRELVTDPARRAEMARKGAAMVDGRGAARIAAILAAAPRDRAGRPLAARPLRAGDADILFDWQSDPASRRYTRNPRSPARPEHDRWIAARLEKVGVWSEMVTRADAPVALVRTDRTDAGTEISILVAPEARGTGVGKAALAYLDALLGDEPVYAVVHPDNAASLAAFRASGYGETGRRRLVVERVTP